MATVDFGHRCEISWASKAQYRDFADELVSATAGESGVRSIVICGSLAKGTLVPGWSDIDIIYFFEGSESPAVSYRGIGRTLKRLQTKSQIPVGVDIVSAQNFVNDYRIGGRPLAMTFEVAGSGQTVFGDDLLSQIQFKHQHIAMVKSETDRLIAAELHNWRRWYISDADGSDEAMALARNTKTLLKLVKYHTDPNLEKPFSYEQSVEQLLDLADLKQFHSVYKLAAETRADWPNLKNQVNEMKLRNGFFSSSLSEMQI